MSAKIRRHQRRWLATCAAFLLALAVSASAQKANDKTLSVGDREAIRVVVERYRTGWLANDTEAVRSTFTKDAVLMPHHGIAPVVGMAAINEFWFPANGTKTTITKFVQTIDEIGGDETLAYVRGTSAVAWTLEDQGSTQNWRNGGNFLAILKKQPNGRWLISHLIWDDPPNQRVGS